MVYSNRSFDVRTSWWRCRTSLESPLISQIFPVDMLAQTLNKLSNAVVVYFRQVYIFSMCDGNVGLLVY